MNRLEFIGQTYHGRLINVEEFVQFFDHMMAAYEIISPIDDYHIYGNMDSSQSSLNLKIESHNLSKLQNVVNYINNTLHNQAQIYGKTFRVDANINGDSIDLFVRYM